MGERAEPTRIFLLRHGATDLSLPPPKMVGRLDPPLNELGRRQAEAAARRVEGERPRAVYVSPLRRARQTAEVIADLLGLPLKVLPDLSEIDYGEWEGRPTAELERDPRFRAFRADPEGNPPPGGEPVGEVARRMVSAIFGIAKEAGGPAVVVGHRTANRLLLCVALGAPLSRYRRIGQDLACLNVLEVDGQEGRLFALTINDTCHLEEVGRKCPSTR